MWAICTRCTELRLSDGSPHSEPLIITRVESCQFADHFVQCQPIKMTSEWIDKRFPQDLVIIPNAKLVSAYNFDSQANATVH